MNDKNKKTFRLTTDWKSIILVTPLLFSLVSVAIISAEKHIEFNGPIINFGLIITTIFLLTFGFILTRVLYLSIFGSKIKINNNGIYLNNKLKNPTKEIKGYMIDHNNLIVVDKIKNYKKGKIEESFWNTRNYIKTEFENHHKEKYSTGKNTPEIEKTLKKIIPEIKKSPNNIKL